MRASPAGNVYVVGNFAEGQLGMVLVPGGGFGAARLSAAGTWQWVNAGLQAPELWPIGVNVNPRTEDVLITGIFKDSLRLNAIRVARAHATGLPTDGAAAVTDLFPNPRQPAQ